MKKNYSEAENVTIMEWDGVAPADIANQFPSGCVISMDADTSDHQLGGQLISETFNHVVVHVLISFFRGGKVHIPLALPCPMLYFIRFYMIISISFLTNMID